MLLAIAKYGGVYLDMDIECLKPLTPLLNVPAFAAKESDKTVCNAVFGSIKNHDWLVKQIMLLPTLDLYSGVTLYPKDFFYPFLWDMPKEYQTPSKNTYLIHHWNKSWLTN